MKNVKVEYKQMLASTGKRFYEKCLSPGFDGGDMSMRDLETGFIYAYPNPKKNFMFYSWSELKPENIAVVDIDGNHIEDEYKPTCEIPMHLEIYKARPETQVILHSHPIWSSVFAACGKNIPLTMIESGVTLGGEIICAEYGLVGSTDLALKVVSALGENNKAALMRNHGAVVIAKSIEEAFTLSDMLEYSAQITLLSQLLGGATSIDQNNILDPSLIGSY